MAASTNTIAKTDETPSTPGLLRLPTELRIQIYEILLTYKVDTRYAFPFENTISLSPRLYALPLPRVCRELRYEAIWFFYGRLWWEVDAPGCLQNDWLQTMDPFAFQCMRGLRIGGFRHDCGHSDENSDERSRCYVYWILVAFGGDSIKVTTEHSRIECSVGRELLNRRLALIERCAEEIERDRNKTKEIVKKMLEQLEELVKEEGPEKKPMRSRKKSPATMFDWCHLDVGREFYDT